MPLAWYSQPRGTHPNNLKRAGRSEEVQKPSGFWRRFLHTFAAVGKKYAAGRLPAQNAKQAGHPSGLSLFLREQLSRLGKRLILPLEPALQLLHACVIPRKIAFLHIVRHLVAQTAVDRRVQAYSRRRLGRSDSGNRRWSRYRHMPDRTSAGSGTQTADASSFLLPYRSSIARAPLAEQQKMVFFGKKMCYACSKPCKQGANMLSCLQRLERYVQNVERRLLYGIRSQAHRRAHLRRRRPRHERGHPRRGRAPPPVSRHRVRRHPPRLERTD